MRHRVLPYLLVIAGLLLALPTGAFTYWNDLRHSALLPDGTVTIRVENPQGASSSILWADGGIQGAPMAAVSDGPGTLEATLPGPTSGPRPYGFRLVQGGQIDVLPVRLPDGATPGPGDLTLLADDPIGDEAFGRPHLDLTGCRVSSDGARLYAALSNVGGGFPVSSGFTFFSYLLGITDPAIADPETVFAMIQTVTAAGIIEPGLYQVNGTGLDDLVKIGEVSVTEVGADNSLVLSCDLDDLLANPVFQSWYDESDPRLGIAAFTQRITILGGAQEADRSPGGIWHQRDAVVSIDGNQVPALADLLLPSPGTGGQASVTYTDADGHCPVLSELLIDGVSYPLRPQSLAYDSPVDYRSEPGLPPLDDDTWTEVVARFSDNLADVVDLVETAGEVGVEAVATGLQLRAAPNPTPGRTEFAFSLPRDQHVELAVFDVAGRRVATLVDGTLAAGRHGQTWDGRDRGGRDQPSGVYIYRLRTTEQVVVQRLTVVR
jgi:hypothetical protein